MINENQSNGANEHGSRTFNDYRRNEKILPHSHYRMAKGADSLGERWAQEHRVKVTYFPALWDKIVCASLQTIIHAVTDNRPTN